MLGSGCTGSCPAEEGMGAIILLRVKGMVQRHDICRVPFAKVCVLIHSAFKHVSHICNRGRVPRFDPLKIRGRHFGHTRIAITRNPPVCLPMLRKGAEEARNRGDIPSRNIAPRGGGLGRVLHPCYRVWTRGYGDKMNKAMETTVRFSVRTTYKTSASRPLRQLQIREVGARLSSLCPPPPTTTCTYPKLPP